MHLKGFKLLQNIAGVLSLFGYVSRIINKKAELKTPLFLIMQFLKEVPNGEAKEGKI